MELRQVVEEIGKKNGVSDYVVFSFGGDTYAFLFLGYYPQEEGRLMVDNYYPAYQRVRKARLELETALAEDYETKPIEHGYKGLAVLSGKAKALANSLTAIEGWGSQFVMEGVCIKGEYVPPVQVPEYLPEAYREALTDRDNPLYAEAWYALCKAREHEKCAGCGKCAAACPQGAIGARFDQEKCLRQMQSAGYVEDATTAKKMGQRVLGCHTCQRVCPLNDLPVVPAEIDGAELLKAALKGKKALQPFADCLGANYLRPAKIVALALNALANAKDGRWRAEALQARERYVDERVQKAVDRYLRATPEIEREVKYMLSEEDWRGLKAQASEKGGATICQVNHYFDVGEGARVRIREKGGKYELTVKIRIDSESLEEHNAPIDGALAATCFADGLTAETIRQYVGLANIADGKYLGRLATERTTWTEEGLTFELDKNEYLGRIDYEIECEVSSDEDWARAEKWIIEHAASAKKGVSKQARFGAARRRSTRE